MKTKNITTISLLVSALLPSVALAVATPGSFRELVNLFLGHMTTIIEILFLIAVLVFLWNIAQLILNAGNSEVNTDMKKKLVWGVVIMFVLVSMWGIIQFLGDSVGISGYF